MGALADYPYKYFNKTCTEDFLKWVKPDLILKDPAKVYDDLTLQVCFNYVGNVENMIKPDTCVYSSFYAMIYLKKAAEKKEDLKLYAENYCARLPFSLYERVQFTRKLWDMRKKKLNTVPFCVDQLKHKLKNDWFSPYMPTNKISATSMCETYQDIMDVMEKKGYTIWRYAIIYMYEVTFQRLLNSVETYYFDTCIPQRIIDTPKKFCELVIKKEAALFTFMSEKDVAPICASSETNVNIHCHNKPCFPCGLALAVIFEKYNAIAHKMIKGMYAFLTKDVDTMLKTPSPTKEITAPPVAPAHGLSVLIPDEKKPKKKGITKF